MKLSKKNDWSKLYGANRLQDIISEYKRIYQTKSNQQQILNKFCDYISNGSVDQNIVELGSAPGGNLVYMNKKFHIVSLSHIIAEIVHRLKFPERIYMK